MNKLLFNTFIVLVFTNLSFSQTLLPSIGIGNLPPDTDSICNIPWYLGSFSNSGKQAGDTAADFTLYNLNGTPFNLATELAKGKPILLVAGNYTCPVFRNKIPSINNVINTYSTQVTTIVYYNVEAHPTDTSPYFGTISTGNPNISAGILYAQPKTYGQRKQIVTDMLNDPTIPLYAPVFIDGPCNNIWAFYGPAPNNAYLIDTTGIIFSKHAWYDKYPDNIICDIDSLLGNTGPCGGTPNNNGTFVYTILSADTIWGVAGTTLTIDAELVNTSANNVLVFMRRLQNNMAPGWSSSMCADVCYPTTTDTATILIPPGYNQSFHYYFYSGIPGPDTSKARMKFTNKNNTNNTYTDNYFGITGNFVGVNNIHSISSPLAIFPVPATERLFIKASFQIIATTITNLEGKIIKATQGPIPDISGLPQGAYFINAYGSNNNIASGKFIKRD